MHHAEKQADRTQLRRLLDQLDATPPCRLRLTLKVIALLGHADSV